MTGNYVRMRSKNYSFFFSFPNSSDYHYFIKYFFFFYNSSSGLKKYFYSLPFLSGFTLILMIYQLFNTIKGNEKFVLFANFFLFSILEFREANENYNNRILIRIENNDYYISRNLLNIDINNLDKKDERELNDEPPSYETLSPSYEYCTKEN